MATLIGWLGAVVAALGVLARGERFVHSRGRRRFAPGKEATHIMAGRIKELLAKLGETRGRGAAAAHFLRSHLILKGINPDAYAADSPDDPVVIAELEGMLQRSAATAPVKVGRT